MLMIKSLSINSDEIFLKGRNIGEFKHAFNTHIRSVLAQTHDYPFRYQKRNCNYVVHSEEAFGESTIERLLKLPGVHSIDLVVKTSRDVDEAATVIARYFEQHSLPKNFKIESKRLDKSFPITSREINRLVGHLLVQRFPQLPVKLNRPEVEIYIKVFEDCFLVRLKRLYGLGGLPLGKTGRVVTLLSGGFDSPVASVMMSKRGCDQTLAFFHAYPFVGHEVANKIKRIASQLSLYQKDCQLYVIPFGGIQKIIAKSCRESYRTVFFRKYMIDCANRLARRVKALALVTGDSLGQVSSQTMGNMGLIDSVSELPIFRPLVGLNKKEILELARKFGTHDISVEPHDDACAMFASKSPVVNPCRGYFNYFHLELEEELEDCLNKAEVYSFDFSGNLTCIS